MALTIQTRERLSAAFRFIVLALCVLVFFMPLISMFVTSFKRMDELYRVPARVLPEQLLWENYERAWTMVQFGRYLLNSLLLTVMYAVPAIMSSCFAGYAFSRFQVKESKALFLVVLSTLMIPAMVTIMPLYMIMAKLQFVNQRILWFFWGLAGIPFIIFLFRQFFMTVPDELCEAHRIDGGSPMQFFFDILLPMSRTSIAALFVILFIYGWNQYLWPLLITTDEKYYTLLIGIKRMLDVGEGQAEWHIIMASTILAMLPPVLVVVLMQKQFVRGMTETEK